jgi:hypothetical protein
VSHRTQKESRKIDSLISLQSEAVAGFTKGKKLLQEQEQARIDALVMRLASMTPSARRQFEKFSKMKVKNQFRLDVFDGEPYFEQRAQAIRAGLIGWQNRFKQNGKIDEESYSREADTQSDRIQSAVRLNSSFRSADSVDQMILLASMTLLAIVLQSGMKSGDLPRDKWEILAEPWKTCEGSSLFLL